MARRDALLEVIACSVADAVEAQHGGAGRLEVISELQRGGLTPKLRLVQQIIAVVSLPVRVMLREQDSYDVSSTKEKDRLCVAARELSALRVEGLVLGFLREGRVDVELTQEILSCAPNLKATFHHAFEETEPFEAIREIKRIDHVDRILTHGGSLAWPGRIEQLAKYQQETHPEIQIIAGGGLDAEKIKDIGKSTAIREFHVGRAARASGRVDGEVQAARVKTLVEAAREE